MFVSLCFPVEMTKTLPLSLFGPLQGEIGRPGSKVNHPSPPVSVIPSHLPTCPWREAIWTCLPPLFPLMWLAYCCALRRTLIVSVAVPHDKSWSHLLSSVTLPLVTSSSSSSFCLFCFLLLSLAWLHQPPLLDSSDADPEPSSTPLLHFNLPKCFCCPW